jgi:hypothetical protein
LGFYLFIYSSLFVVVFNTFLKCFVVLLIGLGPYKGKGDPDLRNLDLLHCGCNDGDILILGKIRFWFINRSADCPVSDGVHDNFDPMHIGKSPKDLGLTDYDHWDDIPDDIATVKKTVCGRFLVSVLFCSFLAPIFQSNSQEFMNKCFTELIHEQERSTMHSFGPAKDVVVTPALITKKAIRYCREITGGSRYA